MRSHAESGGPFRANHDIAIEVENLADPGAFYGVTLGLSVRSRSDEHLELDAARSGCGSIARQR